jgi:hypothetical protein
MWTAIWTLLAFALLLFHGDSILAFAAEQLQQRRGHRLRLEQERTRQALIAHDRDALVWHGREQEQEQTISSSRHPPEAR